MKFFLRQFFDFPCKCCKKERENIGSIICNTCRDFLLESLHNPTIQKTQRGWEVLLLQTEGPMDVILAELKKDYDKKLIKALASIVFLAIQPLNTSYDAIVYISSKYGFLKKLAKEVASIYQIPLVSWDALDKMDIIKKRFLIVVIDLKSLSSNNPVMNDWCIKYQVSFDCIAIR